MATESTPEIKEVYTSAELKKRKNDADATGSCAKVYASLLSFFGGASVLNKQSLRDSLEALRYPLSEHIDLLDSTLSVGTVMYLGATALATIQYFREKSALEEIHADVIDSEGYMPLSSHEQRRNKTFGKEQTDSSVQENAPEIDPDMESILNEINRPTPHSEVFEQNWRYAGSAV